MKSVNLNQVVWLFLFFRIFFFLFLSEIEYVSCLVTVLSFDRSYSPRGRRSPPPRRRSISPRRGRSYSRSPPHRHSRRGSPYANGYVDVPSIDVRIDS